MKLTAILLAATLAAAAGAAEAPRITFSKAFPGSTPAYFAVTVDRTGAATYNESEDADNATKLQLESGMVTELFELTDRLRSVKKPLESGLKVANMGQKKLRWEGGGERWESTFNYSTNEDAKLLTDRFERIEESTRILLELRRVAKHDRLGVNAAILTIQKLWGDKRLVGTTEFLPLLDQVANDEAYIHMARERAAQIADAIRATPVN